MSTLQRAGGESEVLVPEQAIGTVTISSRSDSISLKYLRDYPHRTGNYSLPMLYIPIALLCFKTISKTFSGGVVQIWRRGWHPACWWEVSTRLGGDIRLSSLSSYRNLLSGFFSLLCTGSIIHLHYWQLSDILCACKTCYSHIRFAEQAESDGLKANIQLWTKARSTGDQNKQYS